jgi:hypothetical protein
MLSCPFQTACASALRRRRLGHAFFSKVALGGRAGATSCGSLWTPGLRPWLGLQRHLAMACDRRGYRVALACAAWHGQHIFSMSVE